MPQNTQDRIREKAYQLWEQDGCQEGREVDYWLAAEDNILGSKKKKSAASKSAVAVVSSTKKTVAKKTTTKAKKS